MIYSVLEWVERYNKKRAHRVGKVKYVLWMVDIELRYCIVKMRCAAPVEKICM